METVISVDDKDTHATPSLRVRRLKMRRGSLHRVKLLRNPKLKTTTRVRDRLCKTYFLLYTIWIGLLGLKFQKEEQSPFKTQAFFCFLSPVALCITILVFWILFHTNIPLTYPDSVRKILTSVVCFSGILAHLSLVLLLTIPPHLNWIGYSIISGLLVFMVGYTFFDHLMSLCKKISTIWEQIKGFTENYKASHSTTSIRV